MDVGKQYMECLFCSSSSSSSFASVCVRCFRGFEGQATVKRTNEGGRRGRKGRKRTSCSSRRFLHGFLPAACRTSERAISVTERGSLPLRPTEDERGAQELELCAVFHQAKTWRRIGETDAKTTSNSEKGIYGLCLPAMFAGDFLPSR